MNEATSTPVAVAVAGYTYRSTVALDARRAFAAALHAARGA